MARGDKDYNKVVRSVDGKDSNAKIAAVHKMVEAIINGNTEAATTEFRKYLSLKTRGLLLGEEEEKEDEEKSEKSDDDKEEKSDDDKDNDKDDDSDDNKEEKKDDDKDDDDKDDDSDNDDNDDDESEKKESDDDEK